VSLICATDVAKCAHHVWKQARAARVLVSLNILYCRITFWRRYPQWRSAPRSRVDDQGAPSALYHIGALVPSE
jgi:hypothetical protein